MQKDFLKYDNLFNDLKYWTWNRWFNHDAELAEKNAAVYEKMFKPSLNITENEDNYTIIVELPGVEEKDIHIDVENDQLKIHGKKEYKKEEKDSNYYRMECIYGEFQRILALPADIQKEHINAHLKDGILKITIGRNKKENSNKANIPINKM